MPPLQDLVMRMHRIKQSKDIHSIWGVFDKQMSEWQHQLLFLFKQENQKYCTILLRWDVIARGRVLEQGQVGSSFSI